MKRARRTSPLWRPARGARSRGRGRRGRLTGPARTLPAERMNRISPVTRSPAAGRAVQRGAAVAAVLLAVGAALLAVAGPDLVPAAATDAPRWILGVFGEGLAISPGLFLALLYLTSLAWAALWYLSQRFDSRALWLLIGVLLTLFTLAPPLLSLDLFSYISYGRLGAEEGLNPYEYAPAALPSDQAAERVGDFRFSVSVYGPLFTLITYPLAAVGVGFALWSLKLIAGLSVAAIALLTARLARLRGLAAAPAAAFVALNPLVLVHVVGGGHNDGLMVALALLGVLALLTARPLSAGVALVASVSIKTAGAIYAPFAIAGSSRRGRLGAGLLIGALAVAAVGLLLFGTEVGAALAVAGDNQQTVSRWSVPGTLSRIFDVGVDPIRYLFAAFYGIGLIGLLVWVLRGADWIRAAGWGTFGLLIASAWLAPWYVIWVLPLAAVSRDRPLIAATVLLTLFQAINAVPI